MVKTIFYSANGQDAVRRAKAIHAEHGPESAFVLHADGYTDEPIRGEEIEFLDCVPEWKRERIKSVFAAQLERRRAFKEAEEARRNVRREAPAPTAIAGEDEFRRSLSPRASAPTPGRKRASRPQSADLPTG